MNKFRELMEAVDILVSKRLEKTTTISYGIVKQVLDNKCVIVIKGENYTLPFYGNTPVANKKYPVFLPQGSLSQGFVIG